MIEEIHIAGVYIPAALAWAMVAAVVAYLLRAPVQRLAVDRFLWHPGLADLALFILSWWGLSALADTFLQSGTAP